MKQLLELFKKFDYNLIEFYEKKGQNISQRVLSKILMFTEDSSPRVRQKACETLIAVLPCIKIQNPNISIDQTLLKRIIGCKLLENTDDVSFEYC